MCLQQISSIKLFQADMRRFESYLPLQKNMGDIAQSVEHVNITQREMWIPRTAILMILLEEHVVVGSSPTVAPEINN